MTESLYIEHGDTEDILNAKTLRRKGFNYSLSLQSVCQKESFAPQRLCV